MRTSSGVFLIIPRLGLGHHHFTELVEIHGAGAILQKDNDVLQNICFPTLEHHYLVQFLNDSFQLLISQGGEQFTWLEWKNENCKQGMFVAPIRPLRVSVVMKPWPSLS